MCVYVTPDTPPGHPEPDAAWLLTPTRNLTLLFDGLQSAQDTSACGELETGIERPALQSLDYLLYQVNPFSFLALLWFHVGAVYQEWIAGRDVAYA